MTYYFLCDGKHNCRNTLKDEQYCEDEMLICNNEEYVSKNLRQSLISSML